MPRELRLDLDMDKREGPIYGGRERRRGREGPARSARYGKVGYEQRSPHTFLDRLQTRHGSFLFFCIMNGGILEHLGLEDTG